jgi:hypothetical protein
MNIRKENSWYTEIAKKALQNRSERKAFHFSNVTDSFQIRLTFVMAEYASHFTNATDSFQIRLTVVTAEYASWEIL